MATNNPVSFRLTDEAIEILKWAEEALGLKRSSAIELSLREFRDNRQDTARKNPKKARKRA